MDGNFLVFNVDGLDSGASKKGRGIGNVKARQRGAAKPKGASNARALLGKRRMEAERGIATDVSELNDSDVRKERRVCDSDDKGEAAFPNGPPPCQ